MARKAQRPVKKAATRPPLPIEEKAEGGSGGGLKRSDIQALQRALIRGVWQIPEIASSAIPNMVLRMALNVGSDGKPGTGTYTRREQIRAAELLATIKDAMRHEVKTIFELGLDDDTERKIIQTPIKGPEDLE